VKEGVTVLVCDDDGVPVEEGVTEALGVPV